MGKLIKKPRGNPEKIEPHKWKKGQSGNPAGKPKTPDDIKAARKLTQVEFERICYNLMCMSTGRLAEVVKSNQTPVLTALVARILEKGIHDSSKAELNFFIERFLGKVPEQANFTGNVNGSLADFIAARNAMNDKKQDDEEDFK